MGLIVLFSEAVGWRQLNRENKAINDNDTGYTRAIVSCDVPRYLAAGRPARRSLQSLTLMCLNA